MPEMTFSVRWPDGTAQSLYSPSLVVTDHLQVGVVYPVVDFVERTRAAMRTADERVRARYGFACVEAAATLAAVESAASRYPAEADVAVTGFSR